MMQNVLKTIKFPYLSQIILSLINLIVINYSYVKIHIICCEFIIYFELINYLIIFQNHESNKLLYKMLTYYNYVFIFRLLVYLISTSSCYKKKKKRKKSLQVLLRRP
jgi:hypothetical protein